METQVKGEDYTVEYDAETVTIKFQGQLSLGGPKQYKPISKLLTDVAATGPKAMTLNLRELEFLNSSGISMLSKFVVGLRKKRTTQLIVLGSSSMPWQGKSLKNLQRLLPGLKLEVN